MINLITGGTGFIGSHLARELHKRGEKVILFDVKEDCPIIKDIRDDISIIKGDLGSWPEVLHAVEGNKVDTIFHTGSLLSASAEENPIAGHKVNANGTFTILEAARLFKVKKVIYTSTIASYGIDLPEFVDEYTIQRPRTMYGVTKVFSELLGEYYNVKFGIIFRALRLPSVIGPGRGEGGLSAYSTLMISEPALGRPYTVPVKEDTVMAIQYIKDAVQALIMLRDAKTENLKRNTYNLAGFLPKAIDIVNSVRDYVPDAEIAFAPDEKTVKIVDSWARTIHETRAQEEWGWEPRYFLDETVKDFIRELQDRRDLYA
jgi:threonine 3-dehydrogenase